MQARCGSSVRLELRRYFPQITNHRITCFFAATRDRLNIRPAACHGKRQRVYDYYDEDDDEGRLEPDEDNVRLLKEATPPAARHGQ